MIPTNLFPIQTLIHNPKPRTDREHGRWAKHEVNDLFL